MYRGRVCLGDFLKFDVQCYASGGAEANPTAAPQLTCYNASDTVVTTVNDATMPRQDRAKRTGWFCVSTLIDSGFSVGRYNYRIEWANAGNNFAETGCFEVVAGGDAKGGIVACEFYATPQADYLVTMTESGAMERRKGPYL